ncbi:non-ribosomal peptide synthetase [Gynuella sunshinyii]|uniref:Non-ribosomal peptide synthetase modules-related protein n=1 Tax=Gynuella sunshinyii YC6258 TaxID=1445510 RepID=A0A0C5W4B5_9GAMM|nr:non-ribosomal peptide synthetase [Gynuella sunshinyii]AJQ97469.1 non-ribosomal peptide synthetase modules-related protein [Gynuella sunshinyii YC6258]
MNMTVSRFEQTAMEWIADMLGMDVDELTPELHLDADLALDSIKMMALMSHLSRRMNAHGTPMEGDAVMPEFMVHSQTIGDVIGFLKAQAGLTDDEPVTPDTEKPVASALSAIVEDESLGILYSQYLFVVSRYVAAASALCHTVRLRGPFDLQRAQDCWQALIMRHPALRGYFSIPAGANRMADYRFLLHADPQVPAIKVTDLRHLDHHQKQEHCEQAFEGWINHRWDIRQWPLHQFSVLQLDDDCFELVLASDHAISDGLGNQQMMREFLLLYQAHENGQEPELPPATTADAYRAMVQRLNSYDDADERQWLNQYLQQQGREVFFWNPGQRPPPDKDGRFRNQAYRLSATETAALQQQVARWRVPVNAILVTAMLRALVRLGPEYPRYIIQIPTSGKVYPGADASGMLGPFAQNMALSFAAPRAGESFRQQLEQVQQTLQSALMQGVDRTQTRQLGLVLKDQLEFEGDHLPQWLSQMLSKGVKSNVYMPYTGNSHIERQYGSLAVDGYRAGTYNKAGTIDLQQELFDRRLLVFMNFDSDFFDQSSIDRLADTYLNELRDCVSLLNGKSSVDAVPTGQFADEPLARHIRQLASEILAQPLAAEDCQRDLEGDLGIDSLERVRIITRLIQHYQQRVNRRQLFEARSITEMARAIGASVPAESISYSVDPDAIIPGDDIAPIPYLHFVAQARQNPEQIAISTATTQLSYRELDQRSNQLACYLREQGVSEGDLLAVLCDRGANMVISMLAILKAGAAYLPLDAGLPAARIKAMMELGGAEWLLTEVAVTDKLIGVLTEGAQLQQIVYLDDYASMLPTSLDIQSTQVTRSVWGEYSDEALPLNHNPDALMAVMFTSGSTGTPKGIATTHRSYMSRLRWHQRMFQIRPGERVSQNTSCSFDISIREIFWPLMVGATVCPVDRAIVANPWRLADWLQEQKIQVFQFVPSLFTAFVQAMVNEPWQFPNLRWLLFSTEPLSAKPVRQWIDRFGMRIGIANQYGPSECAIEATCHVVEKRPADDELTIPIGKAMDDVHILLLDENGQRLGFDVMGEVYIGGVQVAQGYLGNDEATNAAFVTNPYPDIPGERLYRTGDLAVMKADGNLIFHGRRDNQIKIRGNRVELGEVEAVLLKDSSVQEAAVIAVDHEEQDGSKRLIAWLKGDAEQEDQIRARLAQTLPNYMLPHRMLWLERLPRNYNGKIERQKLHEQYQQWLQNDDPSEQFEQLLPLGPGQRWLLSYFDEPYQWWGLSRYTFKKPLSPSAFSKSLNRMVNRHASLRTTFVRSSSGEWQQKIHPISAGLKLHPEFLDGTHLSAEQYQQALQAKFTGFADSMRIDCWPLMKVWVVKRAEHRHEICIVAHHMFADMVSGQIMFQQLWQDYSNLLVSDLPDHNDEPEIAGYSDFVNELSQREQKGMLSLDLDYWQTNLTPALAFSADYPDGDNREQSTALASFVLPEEHSDQLLRHARKRFGATLHTVLLAQWYQLMSLKTGQQRVILSHRMNGRDLGDTALRFAHSIGNFAINFPVVVEMPHNASCQQLVAAVQTAFKELPSGGVSYDWLGGKLAENLYPDNKLTPLRINYLGHTDDLDSESFEIDWDTANRRFIPDQQKRTTDIEVLMFFRNKQLHLDIDYSRQRYRDETIQELAEGYFALIRQMMESVEMAL